MYESNCRPISRTLIQGSGGAPSLYTTVNATIHFGPQAGGEVSRPTGADTRNGFDHHHTGGSHRCSE